MFTRLHSDHSGHIRRVFLIAPLLATGLFLLFPLVASAHAILLRSNPAQDAVLSASPQQVQMWFSEDLNPSFSTAAVVNTTNRRVDNADAHVSTNDPREMDVTLQANLSAAVYIVVWRSQSSEDGHILRGSFIFSVASPDGTVPRLQGNVIPGQDLLGGGSFGGSSSSQLDGPGIFNLIVITLVELAAVFWVGAQFWIMFVHQLAPKTNEAVDELNRNIQERFERRYAVPTLLLLLLANIGVLAGQGLSIMGSQWLNAFSPSLLLNLASHGHFGMYWIMREIVVLIALAIALYILIVRNRPKFVNSLLSPINLLLGLLLFSAMSMTSHAAAVSGNIVVYAVLDDWIHLVAAALWVGGMMYIAAVYIPLLRKRAVAEQAQSLITLLPRFSILAITGVILMSITGPFSATVHLNSWQELLSTAYGRSLTIKIALIGGLLITSAIHVFFLRPRVAKEYKKYAYALTGVQFNQAAQVKLREGRLTQRTQRLTTVLRWEPLLGVGVLVCVGLMNVFAGTLTPGGAVAQQPASGNSGPYTTIVKTTDNAFTLHFNVNPNRFGTNIFTVSVTDNKTGKPTTNIGVTVYTTMLDMDMGTENVNLQPDGKGHFTARGDLSMGGNWQIRILVRTPDNGLHVATVKFFTPF